MWDWLCEWLRGALGMAPAAPALLAVLFRVEGEMSRSLQGSFQLSAAAPDVAQRLVTYTVNGAGGGVVDVLKANAFSCQDGDTIAATAVDVSAGGVASPPSASFTIVAVDNTTVPAAPAVEKIAFAPAAAPA